MVKGVKGRSKPKDGVHGISFSDETLSHDSLVRFFLRGDSSIDIAANKNIVIQSFTGLRGKAYSPDGKD